MSLAFQNPSLKQKNTRTKQHKRNKNGNKTKNDTINQCTINQFITNNTLQLTSCPKMKTEEGGSKNSQNLMVSTQNTQITEEGCSNRNNLNLIPQTNRKIKETHKICSGTGNMAELCQNLNCQNKKTTTNDIKEKTINSQCKFTAEAEIPGIKPIYDDQSIVQCPCAANFKRNE